MVNFWLCIDIFFFFFFALDQSCNFPTWDLLKRSHLERIEKMTAKSVFSVQKKDNTCICLKIENSQAIDLYSKCWYFSTTM